jgi:hypothetical protein
MRQPEGQPDRLHLATTQTQPARKPAFDWARHARSRPMLTHRSADALIVRAACAPGCLAHVRISQLLLLPTAPVDASTRAPQVRHTVRRCCFIYPATPPHMLLVPTACFRYRLETRPTLCTQDGHVHKATSATPPRTHAKSSPTQAMHCTRAGRDGLIGSSEPADANTSFTPGDTTANTHQKSICKLHDWLSCAYWVETFPTATLPTFTRPSNHVTKLGCAAKCCNAVRVALPCQATTSVNLQQHCQQLLPFLLHPRRPTLCAGCGALSSRLHTVFSASSLLASGSATNQTTGSAQQSVSHSTL